MLLSGRQAEACLGDRTAMRWFRLRQKWGTCFALAAMLIQLVVASGHIHLDADHDHPHVAHLDAHADVHGDHGAVAPAEHEHDSSGVPHVPDRSHCAACALIHLAQSLVAPTAPVLAQPDLPDRPVTPEPAAALTAQHPALFQARAPPIV
jgi:hypothetical protein